MTYPSQPQGQPRPPMPPGRPAYGQPTPPPRSRNNVIAALAIGFACVAILGIIIVVAVSGSGSDDESAATGATVEYATPPTGKSGDLEFAVLQVATGQPKAGSHTPDGEYISVTVKVTNVGKSAESFDPGSPYVFDAQERMYSADDQASGRTDTELNPGMSVTKTVYYDVPPGTKPTIFSASEGLGVPFARINLPPQG